MASHGAGPVWLCRPGQAKATDPCAYSLAATAVSPAGTLKPATWPRSSSASNFDCFYVHPTDSTASSANTGTALTKSDLVVAVEQAAPLSQVCQVWAPSYDSQTWRSVEEGLAGNEAVMRSTFTVAYNSVLSAWTGSSPIAATSRSSWSGTPRAQPCSYTSSPPRSTTNRRC